MLDFGLAKGMKGEPGRSEIPTQSATGAGLTVGTPAYMSPEQAQGERVDTRSDIFSLGIVFYEMLTGRRPFDGANAASVISAILRDTPRPVNELQPTVPRPLARLVERCLAKRPFESIPVGGRPPAQPRGSKQDVDSGDAFAASRPAPTTRRSVTRRGATVRAVAALGRSPSLWPRTVATGQARPRAAVLKSGPGDLGARYRELPHLVARRPRLAYQANDVKFPCRQQRYLGRAARKVESR